MAPPSPELDAAAARSVPTDAIFEILSRTPIKSLCRFRCACREWRALIAGPTFLAAHKSRAGPQPLLAARYSGTKDLGLRLVDLDGKVVREMKIDVCSYDRPFRLNLFDDRICLIEGRRRLYTHVMDVATGEVLVAEQKLNQRRSRFRDRRSGLQDLIGAGHAALSGALKVVGLSGYLDAGGGLEEQVCEVLELDRGAAGGGDRCWWRDSHSPPTEVAGNPRPRSSAATVDGVVHFLTSQVKVLRFDLETEQWRKTVECPQVEEYPRIAKLNGALCMVAERRRQAADHQQPCIEIWRLSDPENSMWVKAYTVATDRYLMPLMVTPDGRKLLFSAGLPLTWTAPLLYDIRDVPLTWTSPAVRLYDLGDKTWNEAMRISDEKLGGFVPCSLHLEHFLI